VDEPERWRGQRREHQRVLTHLRGDTFAAGDPGPDQVERVRRVQPRAGRALGGATVAAPDVQHSERLSAEENDETTSPVAALTVSE